MSQRKIRTPQSLKGRKLKRYLFKGGMSEKEYQAWCQKRAKKIAKLKRLAKEKADEETKADM